MSVDSESIPVIDVGPLLAKSDDPNMAEDPGVKDVVRQLDEACRDAGFFYAKGHGIPEDFLKEIRDVRRGFFSLAYDEKIKIKMSAETGYRGYQRLGENITKGAADMHEAIDCYREIEQGEYGDLGKPMEGPNLWPDKPANFESLMKKYINLCMDLSRKILQGISIALTGSPLELRCDNPFWVLRIIGYPGPSFSDDNTAIGCGAHTDYGLLTLVNQDNDIRALQVMSKSGEWVWAEPVAGTFVCNIGDMLKILSNGEYESTLHRVVTMSGEYRASTVFFFEPGFDTTIQPLPSCVERANGECKLESVIYGQHLVKKVQSNFANY